MKPETKAYKIIIAVLIFIIVVQWLIISGRKLPVPKEIPPKLKGKIAIVIDDWGYNLNNLPLAEGIKFPLTASVLPNLNYSFRAAEELQQRGIEVILHLPTEPKEQRHLEKNTILASMGEGEIRGILQGDLASLAHVKGVSNHMGSLLCEDNRAMKIILQELKNRKLYFLDSYVSSKSAAFAIAQKIKLPYARRDIFLDNRLDSAYIRSQLEKLKSIARKQGFAIGIGHDHRLTLEVLAAAMPQLEKEGYKFVYVSQLVKTD